MNYLFAVTLLNCAYFGTINSEDWLPPITLPILPWQYEEYMEESNGHRKLSKLYSKNERPIVILGAPFSMGQNKPGAELAPKYIRNQNIVSQIKRLGYNSVTDLGDLKFNFNPKGNNITTKNNFTEIYNQYTVRDANLLIENRIEKILSRGKTLVVLGGDHSLTAGSILGNAKANPDLCVLYVDAHGDINNCESTRSGHLHGMPLSFVIKEMAGAHQNFKACPAMEVFKPSIPASAIALIGTRDLDDSELDIINYFNITHFSMKDIDVMGMDAVVSHTLNTVCKSKSRIHVSFDIDSLDKLYTPNTGTPVLGGLTIREALHFAERIAATNKLNVIELYEVNPLLEPHEWAQQTVNIGLNIILSFLGKSREVYWAQLWEGSSGEQPGK